MSQNLGYLNMVPDVVKRTIQERTGETAIMRALGEAYGFQVLNKGPKTCTVRFYGPRHEENDKLNKYADALRRDGYEVEFKEENSLQPNTAKGIREQRARRNRRFLSVKKRKGIPMNLQPLKDGQTIGQVKGSRS